MKMAKDCKYYILFNLKTQGVLGVGSGFYTSDADCHSSERGWKINFTIKDQNDQSEERTLTLHFDEGE